MVCIKKTIKKRSRLRCSGYNSTQNAIFYFSEIKIGPLKRILVRGAKVTMRPYRRRNMRRTKKNRPHLYGTIQFSTASSIQNCIKTSNKKKLNQYGPLKVNNTSADSKFRAVSFEYYLLSLVNSLFVQLIYSVEQIYDECGQGIWQVVT